MDYTKERLGFRVKKALRYARMYGLRRTLVKIRGQYHMRRRYDVLPTLPTPPETAHVGLIGCGNFAFSNIAYYLRKNYGRVIRAAMDVDVHRAASLAAAYAAGYYTDKSETLLDDKNIDILFIASNHSTHAEYAIAGLREGKAVHIEKPHVVNEDQLIRLCRAIREHDGKVALGFNRPLSRIGTTIAEQLHKEPGPAMFNWFVAGHQIDPDHWYFHEKEGGRILGNLCHWTDFVYRLVPPESRYPIVINPTASKKSDCDIAVTFTFGDGTISAITFSAKGHTFEGVRERFAAHKSNTLVAMDDFQTLTIEVVEEKRRIRLRHRDHGHERAIRQSYGLVRADGAGAAGSPLAYIWETGELFLRTKEALGARQAVVVEPFADSRL
jgi:predicted dehydrogenase